MSSKKVLGLDLGTTSIGWALVNERENGESQIIKLGVRVNPLTVDEKTDFEKGKPLSTNADRTLKRGARRNLQRFKQRRSNLIKILTEANIIRPDSNLCEVGKNTTFQTLNLRARAASDKIDLEDFAKVLLTINKKRGYKSSRKSKGEEEGTLIDGMAIARLLYDDDITPGEYIFKQLQNNKHFIPDFYLSDLKGEFDKVWNFQKQFYPTLLSDELYEELEGKGSKATWAICKEPFGIDGIKLTGKRDEIKIRKYELRAVALREKLDLELLAIVLQEINNNLNKSSGYLGAISDRSKKLYFNKLTVGQYLFQQIAENRHTSLKNQVFYRQDYLDEFERIWETQSKFHKELTSDLKTEIRDVVIFYQRRLKSQKHLISECQFEKHHKVVPKSSPIFQEFKVWQNLNSLEVKSLAKDEVFKLDEEAKAVLYSELNLRGKQDEKTVLKILGLDTKKWKTNFPEGLEGNTFNSAILNAFQEILSAEGYGFDWSKKNC
jgi:CRISPR-associated endonuclease Csn1